MSEIISPILGLTYGELMMLTRGNGTSNIYERINAHDALQRQRIAELEAEVARLTAMQDTYKVAALENANTRIMELEAEVARLREELYDLTAKAKVVVAKIEAAMKRRG